MQEFASEFIKFVTSEAQEQSEDAKRKTITGEDVLHSLNRLGFDQYHQTTNWYYNHYKRVKEQKPNASATGQGVEAAGVSEAAKGGSNWKI